MTGFLGVLAKPSSTSAVLFSMAGLFLWVGNGIGWAFLGLGLFWGLLWAGFFKKF